MVEEGLKKSQCIETVSGGLRSKKIYSISQLTRKKVEEQLRGKLILKKSW